jgi:hypothetical protein
MNSASWMAYEAIRSREEFRFGHQSIRHLVSGRLFNGCPSGPRTLKRKTEAKPWAGVGKSTLVNHWLRRMAADHYRSAELIFGWSFYRQGSSGETSSADEFLDAALTWFGDPDPQKIGTAWEKGERLAKLVAHRRTLLVLDYASLPPSIRGEDTKRNLKHVGYLFSLVKTQRKLLT